MIFKERKMWKNGMKRVQSSKISLEANSVGRQKYNRRGFENIHFTGYYLSAMSVLTSQPKGNI